MSKASHLKKFIPLSLLIHAGAIFAAGLAATPLILKDNASVEVEFGSGDSSLPETLGVDVIATQGTFNESAPTDSSETTSAVITKEVTPTAPLEKSAVVKTPAPMKTTTPLISTPVVVEKSTSETIQTEDLSIASAASVAPTTAPADVAPEVAEDIVSAIPQADIKENTITPQTPQQAEVVQKIVEEKTVENSPATTAVTAVTANATESKTSDLSKNSESAITASGNSNNKIASKDSVGEGAGTNGTNAPSQQLAGSAGGVKSLEQFRQKAGNPKPRYDRDERLRGDKGTVVFKAYINNAGSPVKIEKITSSGHPNLDSKSEKALLKWKFEAGQEGWVEVPFKWELKGDALESGGTLRRSAANPVEIP